MVQVADLMSGSQPQLASRGFKKDCPGGLLCKEKVLEMYTMILPEGNAVNFVEQIFRVFDKDGDGTIDFKVGDDILSDGQLPVSGVHVGHRHDVQRVSRGEAEVGLQDVRQGRVW